MNDGHELPPKTNQDLKSALGRAINNLELSIKKGEKIEWFDRPEPIQPPTDTSEETPTEK
jgi:hypothetical protein